MQISYDKGLQTQGYRTTGHFKSAAAVKISNLCLTGQNVLTDPSVCLLSPPTTWPTQAATAGKNWPITELLYHLRPNHNIIILPATVSAAAAMCLLHLVWKIQPRQAGIIARELQANEGRTWSAKCFRCQLTDESVTYQIFPAAKGYEWKYIQEYSWNFGSWQYPSCAQRTDARASIFKQLRWQWFCVEGSCVN